MVPGTGAKDLRIPGRVLGYAARCVPDTAGRSSEKCAKRVHSRELRGDLSEKEMRWTH